MSIDFAVLSLVVARPSYANEVSARFVDRFSEFYAARPQSAFEALTRLHDSGLIEPVAAAAQGSDRAPRTPYQATTEGVRQIEQWIRSDLPSVGVQHELLRRIACTPPTDFDGLEMLLDQYEAAITAEAKRLPCGGLRLPGRRWLVERHRLAYAREQQWLWWARADLRRRRRLAAASS